MKNSFMVFTVFVGLLVVLIILRLNSISYPGDIADNTEVVYLEEFHGYGSLFDIDYKKDRFRIKPLDSNIKVRGKFVLGTVEIGDGDLIAVENRRFLFQVLPRSGEFREVFHRPLRGVFLHPKDLKYIGGWTGPDRQEILSKKENQALLKKLLVEIAAEELKKIIPAEEGKEGKEHFDGKLLELSAPSGVLRVRSSSLPIVLVRDWEELPVEKGRFISPQDGDLVKIPYGTAKSGREDALLIRFGLTRTRGVDYLAIAYKEKKPSLHLEEQGAESAFLKSPDTGKTYRIDRKKKNTFIGSSGLFSFNLEPRRLLDKLYIPDTIPEGGVVDIEELVDRDMYYRQDNDFHPVTREFLARINEIFKTGRDPGELRRFVKENKIAWRSFDSISQFKRFFKTARALIHKMENKGTFQVFCREIEKLNGGYRIEGVGLGVDRRLLRDVIYKMPGRAWLRAERIRENTPIVSGIEDFYWGELIESTDEPVEFRVRFSQPPASLRLIAAADYGTSFDGRQYAAKNFFDGVQTFAFPKGQDYIYIKVRNIKSFNRDRGATNLQVEVNLEQPNGEMMRLWSDHTWEGSVNAVHWSDVRVNPPYSYPDPVAGQAGSIWYDETWNPVYRGIKSRYFRKKFQLEAVPRSVTWKISSIGEWLLQVNRQVIQTEKEFLAALKKGTNVITVMVTRRGYRKHFYISPVFRVWDNRIVLKQQRVQRAGSRGIEQPRLPFILDLNNTPLAYSSLVNGEPRRFYDARALEELQGFLGSPDRGIWGLEQIFAGLYRENRIASIRLTLNREWQSLVLAAMKKTLLANRDKELKNPAFNKLSKELAVLQTRLQQKRGELASSKTLDRPKIMQTIIQLQREIEALKNQVSKIKNPFYEAAVVLMSPGGEIRAAASYPYDDKTMVELNPHIARPYRPGENPYFNRGWEWKYNPGSTAKLLDCAAFLESKDKKDAQGRYLFPYLRRLLDPGRSFSGFPRSDLKGSSMLNGKEIGFHLRNFQGHTIPEGFCSLQEALTHSYNTYFSYLALHNNRVLTHDSLVYAEAANRNNKRYFISKANIPVTQTYSEYPILELAEKLRMNRKIDLLYNLRDTFFGPGLVRQANDAFMAVESKFPVNAYTVSNIAHYSIGQGDFQVTALQNAMIAAVIFNRGTYYRPFLVKAVTAKEGKSSFIANPEKDKYPVFSASVANQVKEAMGEVVSGGTAAGLFQELREGRRFYAKTGTAETEFYKDNSLFVGFVVFKDGTPLIFSVIVPRSGVGAEVAGKLTEDILTAVIAYENKASEKL